VKSQASAWLRTAFDAGGNEVYMGAVESNAVFRYRPQISLVVETFLRDLRLQCAESVVVGIDGEFCVRT